MNEKLELRNKEVAAGCVCCGRYMGSLAVGFLCASCRTPIANDFAPLEVAI